MAVEEIVKDPKLVAVINASRDARIQALTLVDQVAAAVPVESAPAEAQLEISKQQKLLITHLAQVRGLHRAATFSSRKTKQETAEARQEVDRLHLQLQNLYYEQRHLQGEIAACESYECVPPSTPRGSKPRLVKRRCLGVVSRLRLRLAPGPITARHRVPACNYASARERELTRLCRHSHTYQQLPLIPVEEFLALKPEHADDDENALMIARIEHERTERESLEQKRMELLKRKQKLIADNKKRKDDLANLDKELEKFIDVGCHISSLVDDDTNMT